MANPRCRKGDNLSSSLEDGTSSQELETGGEVATASPAAPCSHIFCPVDFFDNETSPGFAYLNHLKHLNRATETHGLAIVGIHHNTFTKANVGEHNEGGEEEEFHLVYNSVPKAATTTMINAMKNLSKNLESSTNQLNGEYNGKIWENDEMIALMENMEHQGMNSASIATSAVSPSLPKPSQLQSQSQKTFRYFGIMRDPVSRFVSATAEEMNLKARRIGLAKDYREQCLKETASETLQCAIDYVRDAFTKKYLKRMHYAPSATTFYRRNFGHDVPIELIEFNKLRDLMAETFLLGNLQKNTQQDKETGADGDDIVVNMSVSDLSEDMIEEICALYAIDVLIMRHLNMEDKYCKGHVSDKYVSTLYWGKVW